MTKIKILACVLTVLFATSCQKDKIPSSISNTKWENTILQVTITLSFTNNTNGTLTIISREQEIDEHITFTYTYTKPDVLLKPSTPPYNTEFPIGIKAVVRSEDVMDFSDFAKSQFPGIVELVLVKKK